MDINLQPADEGAYSRYNQYGDNPMAPVGPIALVPLKGSVEFTDKVNWYLNKRRSEYQQQEFISKYPGFYREDYRISVRNDRFSSGEGKAVIESSVRGHDLFIISDVTNYSCTYKMFGQENHMSPDDHYQDLKRVILACSGKARRINVIMPYLYEGRQHKRNSRESLDCAFALEEIYGLGVENIITFDAHDERVANAIPTSGFESLSATYQIIKEMYRSIPDLHFSDGKFMVISPDEGGISRAMYFASILGVPLGTFYKRRDYTTVVNGRNPIVAHEFLGDDVNGMDILIVDDMISSGDSMLDIAREMKERGARNIYCTATFALFTDGIAKFEEAYQKGYISKVFSTNLIYRRPELLASKWFADVNMSKFVALLIDAINHDSSLSNLIRPTEKIKKLLASKGDLKEPEAEANKNASSDSAKN